MDAEPANPSPQEVLSQSEVESLLAQVAEQENSVAVHTADDRVERLSREAVQAYDFRRPAFLSAGDLRRLRLRHEEYVRSLAARLSIYLRLEFTLQLQKLHILTYQKFIEALADPTHLTSFKVEPLRGICVLDIHPRLGLTIVDRLLGGAAHSVNPDHEFSDIELALLDQAIQVVLTEWCGLWKATEGLQPVLLGHETNARFVQAAPYDTAMMVLVLEATLGDCREQIQIGFPYYILEPLMRASQQTNEPAASGPDFSSVAPVSWNHELDNVVIPISAQWQGLELTAGELAQLKAGDVLQLASEHAQAVDVRLADLPKFRGRLGTQGGKWAVEITEVIQR